MKKDIRRDSMVRPRCWTCCKRPHAFEEEESEGVDEFTESD